MPSQECEVDILQTLGRSNSSYAQPGRPAREPNYVSRSRDLPPAPATQSLSASTKPGGVKASEDDFVRDMEAILSGKMLYDRPSKSTKPKEAINRAPQPRPNNHHPSPNEQASSIGSRKAWSMRTNTIWGHSNSRIVSSDFDRISEIQDKATRDSKLKRSQNTSSGPSAKPALTALISFRTWIRLDNSQRQPSLQRRRLEARSQSQSARAR
jgi:hypothetical protein